MKHSLPSVAIIGRPNVGKSTLFNRLTGTRHALVANTPGVTRDRREGLADIGGLEFKLIDTAGLEESTKHSLAERMTNQTLEGLKRADVILMLVDARAGILPTDEHFAALVRESGKPVILAVNKAEGRGAQGALDAYSLGLGDPCPISAEHGEGMGDLYDALITNFNRIEESSAKSRRELPSQFIAAEGSENLEEEKDIQIAVVGRPNVGKSTFINQLLGEDRVLTGPEAGITRDAISIPFDYNGRALQLVDTAGMRRKSKVAPHELEVMAVNDTRRAIQYAHVVVLMLDATQALEKQDHLIASMLAKEGRACVLCLNKWDLVQDKDEVLTEVRWQVEKIMGDFKGLPVVCTTALTGDAVSKVIKTCLDAYALWNKRVGTAELNRWLEDVLVAHTPPLVSGRRLKIKYITQAKTRPPSFALFVNHKGGIPSHYARYLINSLRETFNLPGIPIRLMIRRGKNPYEKDN
jgi:GTP-binding protein